MSTLPDPSTTKVAKHREKMRAAGMRPIQFWVPDTRSAAFAAQLESQCKALSSDPAELEILAFTEAAAIEIRGWK